MLMKVTLRLLIAKSDHGGQLCGCLPDTFAVMLARRLNRLPLAIAKSGAYPSQAADRFDDSSSASCTIEAD